MKHIAVVGALAAVLFAGTTANPTCAANGTCPGCSLVTRFPHFVSQVKIVLEQRQFGHGSPPGR
jgi:hypothetical protein